jgi:hypothetical protein
MPKRTVSTEPELDAYLADVRGKVAEIIKQGPVVLS